MFNCWQYTYTFTDCLSDFYLAQFSFIFLIPTFFTGGKEAGITDVLRSFDKMKVYDEPDKKSLKSDQNEPKVYTGSHEQFAPEPVENPLLDTITNDPSNPNSSYKQRISSATSAITDKASALKDSIVSKLSSSDENKNMSTEAHKTNTKSSSPTVYAHMVAETLSGTLGPVYEKVADAGSSVMSKMQGSGQHGSSAESEKAPESKGVTVKEYLVNTLKPRDDDKVLSDVITHAFHRGKANEPQLETTSTTTTYGKYHCRTSSLVTITNDILMYELIVERHHLLQLLMTF